MRTEGKAGAVTTASDAGPSVHRTFAIVRFPPPHFLLDKPVPPIVGYYGWKISFDGETLTVVLRPDSAMSTSNHQRAVSTSTLYLCATPATPIMECQTALSGRARLTAQVLELEINELSFINRLRNARPNWATRQSFEPGGHFRVDRLPIKYR